MVRIRGQRQSGQSMVSVIGLTSIVALLVIASLAWARSSTSQGARDVREDRALHERRQQDARKAVGMGKRHRCENDLVRLKPHG